jgi:glycosyltransferase involved in cell wall biosynthesis
MKICFITSSTITQHATMKRAFGMANPLIEQGHYVTIVLQDSIDNRKAMEYCPSANAFYYQAGSANYERSQKREFLQENCFDVVHICGLGWRNALHHKSSSSTFTIMDHVELESSLSGISHLRRLLQFLLEAWSLLSYDGSVLASKYLEFLFRRRLHRLGKNRQLLYLPYAYDPQRLSLDQHKVDILHDSYPDHKLVIYMGGIYRNYGCFEILDALPILIKEYQKVKVLFIGRGPDKEEAIQYAISHGMDSFVEFKGYLHEDEIPTYLYGADVLLSPLHDTVADWARCPSKLLMYMATQKPIVTCCIGEAREYLGNDGFYYQPNSPSSLASTILQALNKSESGWKPSYDINCHTWETRVKAWLKWIEQYQSR